MPSTNAATSPGKLAVPFKLKTVVTPVELYVIVETTGNAVIGAVALSGYVAIIYLFSVFS
jgi:hypothetical protein